VDLTKEQNLQLARATAIDQYAKLEHLLATLFANFLRTEVEMAAVVFHRIVNTRSRNAILTDLLPRRYGSTYDIFWNGLRVMGQKPIPGLIGLVGQIDQGRNEIVHWTDAVGEKDEHFLVPPTFWTKETPSARLRVTDIIAFTAKAEFLAGLAMHFFLYLSNISLTAEKRDTWQKIFEQPVSYPPPSSHPLFQNYARHQIPPQSSQA
jgi:hypothetical protein